MAKVINYKHKQSIGRIPTSLTGEAENSVVEKYPDREPLRTGIPVLDLMYGSTEEIEDPKTGKKLVRNTGGLKQITIIAGHTGAGKTTNLAQYLLHLLVKNPTACSRIFIREDGQNQQRLYQLGISNGLSKEMLKDILGMTSPDEVPPDTDTLGVTHRMDVVSRTVDIDGFWEYISTLYRTIMTNAVGCKMSDDPETPLKVMKWPNLPDGHLSKVLDNIPPTIIVLDPLAATPPRNNASGNRFGMERAAVTSRNLAQLLGRLKFARIHLIFVNHPGAKISLAATDKYKLHNAGSMNLGKDLNLPGGVALQNDANSTLLFRQEAGGEFGHPDSKSSKNCNYGPLIQGYRVSLLVVKGRECPAGIQQTLYFSPSEGIIPTITMFEFLVTKKVIEARSGNYWIPGVKGSITRNQLGGWFKDPKLRKILEYHYTREMRKMFTKHTEALEISEAPSPDIAADAIRTIEGLDAFKTRFNSGIPESISTWLPTEWSSEAVAFLKAEMAKEANAAWAKHTPLGFNLEVDIELPEVIV